VPRVRQEEAGTKSFRVRLDLGYRTLGRLELRSQRRLKHQELIRPGAELFFQKQT